MFVRIRRAYRGYFLGGSALLALLSLGGSRSRANKASRSRGAGNKTEAGQTPGGRASRLHRRRPLRRPNNSPPSRTPSTRRAAISTRPSARRRTRSVTPPSTRFRGSTNTRSRKSCCRRPASRRIPPPAASFMCATITPTCSFASMASCCPTASPASAAFSTPAGSAASRWSPARCRPNSACARSASSTSRPAADIFNNSGSVSLYGGSHGTITPSFEYGGTFGSTCPTGAPVAGKATPSSATRTALPGVQYFFTGRYLQTKEGIENPTPAYSADPRFLAAGERLRLHVDVRRPEHAGEPDRGNVDQHVPDSQRARATGRAERKSSGHQRVRRHQFQFGAAQREPVRGHAIRRAGAAEIEQTASTGNCLISPATTVCTSRRTRSAIC